MTSTISDKTDPHHSMISNVNGNHRDTQSPPSSKGVTPTSSLDVPEPDSPVPESNGNASTLAPVVGRNRKASTVTNKFRKDSSADAQADLTFKVMLVGDTCTGKTCTLLRFKENVFLASNFISTVGIDYRNKVVHVSGKVVKLQIWDTAGQERFRSVTHSYYRDAHGIFLLFDVTNESSFFNVRDWLSEVKEHAPKEIVVVLIGNKVDVPEKRKVRSDEAKRLAEEFDVSYIETSAKTGYNVELAFTSLAKELTMRKIDPKQCDGRFAIVDLHQPAQHGGSCYYCGT